MAENRIKEQISNKKRWLAEERLNNGHPLGLEASKHFKFQGKLKNEFTATPGKETSKRLFMILIIIYALIYLRESVRYIIIEFQCRSIERWKSLEKEVSAMLFWLNQKRVKSNT